MTFSNMVQHSSWIVKMVEVFMVKRLWWKLDISLWSNVEGIIWTITECWKLIFSATQSCWSSFVTPGLCGKTDNDVDLYTIKKKSYNMASIDNSIEQRSSIADHTRRKKKNSFSLIQAPFACMLSLSQAPCFSCRAGTSHRCHFQSANLRGSKKFFVSHCWWRI